MPEVVNLCGRWGAEAADLLYTAVGWGAWPLGLLMLLGPVPLLANRPLPPLLRTLAVALVYLLLLTGFALAFDPPRPVGPPPAGLVGELAAASLTEVAHPVGAWILVLGLGITALGYATGLSCARATPGRRADRGRGARRARRRPRGGRHGLGVDGGRLAALGRALKAGAVGLANLFWRGLKHFGDLAIEAVVAVKDAALDIARRALAAIRRRPPEELDDAAYYAITEGGTAVPADTSTGWTAPVSFATVGIPLGGRAAQVSWDHTQPGHVEQVLDLFPKLAPRDGQPAATAEPPARAYDLPSDTLHPPFGDDDRTPDHTRLRPSLSHLPSRSCLRGRRPATLRRGRPGASAPPRPLRPPSPRSRRRSSAGAPPQPRPRPPCRCPSRPRPRLRLPGPRLPPPPSRARPPASRWPSSPSRASGSAPRTTAPASAPTTTSSSSCRRSRSSTRSPSNAPAYDQSEDLRRSWRREGRGEARVLQDQKARSSGIRPWSGGHDLRVRCRPPAIKVSAHRQSLGDDLAHGAASAKSASASSRRSPARASSASRSRAPSAG